MLVGKAKRSSLLFQIVNSAKAFNKIGLRSFVDIDEKVYRKLHYYKLF
jgi:hypothetical protein